MRVQEKDAERIYKAAASGDLAGVEDLKISAEDEEFLAKQTRIALRHCGVINPESLDSYRATDGYKAIAKILGKSGALGDRALPEGAAMTPEQVIEEIKVSGLAGRGGAGFPTWFKWNAARDAKGDEKYLICNADEGDPGAFMDRAVIEGDPHSLIEGMLIAAYAIGASKAFVYVRAEYPLAIVRLEKAIKDATAANLLGANILAFAKAIKNGVDWSCLPAYLIGTVVAILTGIASISLLKRIADKGKFGGFAYYCWVVGVLSIILTVIF